MGPTLHWGIAMVGKVMISMVALLLVSVSPAEARINPKYLKQAQRYAPEKLVLQVLKVSSIKQGRDRVVNATAEVKEVRESATGLKVGDRIKITYTSRGKRGPGYARPQERRESTRMPRPKPPFGLSFDARFSTRLPLPKGTSESPPQGPP
jgi:hypothetical protein